MNQTPFAVKIQAVWRGYRSRKGQVLPCCLCGYDMTLQAPVYPETMSAVFFSNAPCSWCQAKEQGPAEPCGCPECVPQPVEPCTCSECTGEDEYEERFIPCCMCGNNCADEDYESWRFCSRRCMVEASRD
jgi:hypothetical protein